MRNHWDIPSLSALDGKVSQLLYNSTLFGVLG